MRLPSSNIKLFLFLWFAICFVQANKSFAQTTYQLPPNQPEQDACHAIRLCGNTFYTPYSYTGAGKKLDLDSTPCSLNHGGGETNSVWLRIHTLNAGNVVFTIKPVSQYDDYDFAVVDITGKNCGEIYSKDVIRCNYNSNLPNSNPGGIIGLDNVSRTPYISGGTFGSSFGQAILAKSGGDYLILVNNYGNYVNGGPSQGFSIDFTGSSATFYNTPAPALQSIDELCGDNSSLLIKTSSQVLCSSIAGDGSNFTSDAPAAITSASGFNCTGQNGYTSSILLHFNAPLPAGNYTISAKKGSSNNAITDFCNNEIQPGSIPFIIQPGSKVVVDNETICFEQLPYIWNGHQYTSGGDNIASYTTPSAAGCDSITVLNLKVLQPPVVINTSARICDGDSYVLPWNATVTEAGTYSRHYTNINGCDSLTENVTITVFTPPGGTVEARDSTIQTGFCRGSSVLLDGTSKFTSYLWNTGQTTQVIKVDIAGSYGLEAKDSYGCTTIDTFVVAAYPRPAANFSNTENLCADSVKLLDGGKGYISYLWDDGSIGQTITVSNPGIYWVYITDKKNCTNTDTVHVVTVPRPSGFLAGNITKCALKNASLSPSQNFDTYIWSNGATNQTINVNPAGIYQLTVTDHFGCTGRDSILVIDSICPVYFYMPTAFTPNNDGHNDLFKPKFSGAIAGYHFVIYNRWGQLIFSTKDDSKGWDGTVNYQPQQTGTYMWMCTYSLDGRATQTDRGTVTLLR